MNKNVRLLENGNLQVDTDLTPEDALELPTHLANVLSDYVSGQKTHEGSDSFWFIIKLVKQFFPNDHQLSVAVTKELIKRRKANH